MRREYVLWLPIRAVTSKLPPGRKKLMPPNTPKLVTASPGDGAERVKLPPTFQPDHQPPQQSRTD